MITVKELKERLERLPEDQPVVVQTRQYGAPPMQVELYVGRVADPDKVVIYVFTPDKKK